MMAAAATSSPKTAPHSEYDLFEVTMMLPLVWRLEQEAGGDLV